MLFCLNNAVTYVVNTNKRAVPDVQVGIMEGNKTYKRHSIITGTKSFLFRAKRKREKKLSSTKLHFIY